MATAKREPLTGPQWDDAQFELVDDGEPEPKRGGGLTDAEIDDLLSRPVDEEAS